MAVYIPLTSDENIDKSRLINIMVKLLVSIKPIKVIDSMYKVFGIWEDSCSQKGVYQLCVSDARCLFTITSWGRTKVLAEFSSLNDAVNYLFTFFKND